MKKFSFLIAAVMVASTLIGFDGSAQASPYPGTVKTKCHLAYAHHRSHKKKIHPRAWVTSSSNLKAKGKITITVTGKGRHWKTFKYGGGAANRNMGKFKKGTHRIKIVFRPAKHSVFKGCSYTGHKIRIR